MTSIRITTEHKTILDFGNSKISHHQAAGKIRCVDFLEFKSKDNLRTYLTYDIKVGIYTIFVDLFHTQSCAKKLKDYKQLGIRVFEGNKEIDLNKDSRFSLESWIKANKKLRIKPYHLAEAITFCSRLNHIKAFL
jgi:hypothetical protein